jgi:predicted DsbA family dithiol-disulfide isomerase
MIHHLSGGTDMSLTIQVYTDFVCPFCYLGKKPLEEAAAGKDVTIEWMPFELRPAPMEPIDPWEDPSKLSAWEQFIYPKAREWGVDMKLPHVSPHPYTGLAFEGFQFAKEHGKANAYYDRVADAFYREEQDIGSIEVLAKLAGEIGLDRELFKAALEQGTYKEAHRKALQTAAANRISAVPTFIVGNRAIQGIASKETLEKLIADANASL